MKPNRRNPLFSNSFRRNTLATAIVVSLGSFAVLPVALAADIYWDNDGVTSNDWASIDNWSTVSVGGVNPLLIPASSDIAVFSATSVVTGQTVNLNAAQSLAGLSFTSSQAHSLLGGAGDQILTLGANGITKTGSGAITIGSPAAGQQVALALSADQTWSNSDNTSAISVLNGVSSSTAVARLLTLGGTSTAASTISGIIADNGAGAMSLTKADAGTWVLAGANTYTGTTTLSAGVLRATTSAQALGTGAASLSLGGGELQLANDTGLAFNRNTTLTGNALITTDTLTAVAGVSHTLGTLNMGAQTLSIAKGSNATGSTAGVTFGAVTLTGAPTFSLGANSALTLGAVTGTDQPLTFNGSGAANLTGILGTGAGALNINGGTVTLSNAGNTFTGAINVDGAGSVLAYTGTAGSADPGPLGTGPKLVTLTNGGAVRVITTGSNPTAGSKNFVIGSGGGTFDIPSGLTLTLDDGTGSGVGGNTAQLQGSGNLTKTGLGTLALGYSGQTGANTPGGGFAGYTGNILVSAGTLQSGNSNALGSGAGSTTTVISGGALDFISSTQTIADDLTISGSGPSGAGALLVSSTISATSTGTLTMAADSSIGASGTGALTINGVTSGAFNLTKVGVGTGIVTLANAANTYTGTTTITAGTLAGTTIADVGGGNTSFGNVTTVSGGTIAVGSTTATGTLVVNAITPSTTNRVIDLAGTTFGGGVGSSGTAPVTFTSSPTATGTGAKQFILTGTNAGANTFNAVIGDAGGNVIGLNKTGTGTWILPSGIANTYTGVTNLSAGVLSVNNAASLGTTAGGTLQSGTSELRLSGGIIVGAETLTITGGGIGNRGALRNSSGNNSWGGAITLTAQSRINSDSGTLTINNTITGANFGLVVGGSGNLVLNNPLSFGTGVLSKADGAGTLTLNAASTHTGVTTVSAGRLLLGPGGGFAGVTAATVANGATLAVGQTASASTNTLGGALTLAAGSQFTMADGFTSTLAVTGATTYGGTSASRLTFDIGGLTTAADRINSTGTALISAAGATIGINSIGATPLALGSYNLITGGASSQLATNPFSLSTTKVYAAGTPYLLSLTNATTTVNLNVGAFSGLDTAYWKGDLGTTWNDLSSGSNWDTTETGAVDANALPTSVTDVFIHATLAGGLNQTLGQDFTINSLNYTAASSASTIGAGNTLTLAAAGSGNIGINVASGAAAQTINAPLIVSQNQVWNNSSGNALTVGGNITGNGGITTTGTGTINLSGSTNSFGGGLTVTGTGTINLSGTANASAGGLTVSAGTVNLSGTTNAFAAGLTVSGGNVNLLTGAGFNTGATGQVTVGNTTTANAILTINGGTLNAEKTASPSIAVGSILNSAGAIRLTSGSLTTASELHLGRGDGGYAALTMSSGTLTSATWMAVGLNNDNAVFNQTGGIATVATNRLTIGAGGANSIGVANLSGGTFTSAGGIFIGENGTGTLNISGSANVTAGNVQFNNNASSLAGNLNLNGGTLNAATITKGVGTGIYRLNFDGGTIKATAGGTLMAALANTTAYINSGGATINTNGFSTTIAQALLAPTGNGVSSTGLSVSGSGFIDTPLVSITGGGGTGATAVATIDGSGNLTGIVMTNPGIGYTSPPTFALLGGGIGNTGAIGGAASLAANSSGGLTKIGAGVLALNGANTYTGPTTVNAGGITIGNTYATSGFIFAPGTTLGFSNAAALTVPESFSLPTILTKTGNGFVTLTGTNSFGGINSAVNGGGLIFDSAAALGPIAGRTIVSNASLILNYATSLQSQLVGSINGLSAGSLGLSSLNNLAENLDFSAASGANQTGLHLGAATGQTVTYTGTITPNGGVYRLGGSGGTLTLSNTNALTGTHSVNFHGIGGGTTILSSTNNYSGGTTFIGNSYTVSFVDGALGSGPISFSSPGSTLRWATGNTQDISASRTITFNGGSTANFDTNGNNVILASPIGNFGAGGLTKAGAGLLTLGAANTFTGATSVTGGAIKLANADALKNSAVTVGVANGLTFDTTSGTYNLGALTGATSTGAFAIQNTSAAAINLRVGFSNTATTQAGIMSGAGSLTKVGNAQILGTAVSNQLTLGGQNTYTGTTTISGGFSTPQNFASGIMLDFANGAAPATGSTTGIIRASNALVFGGSALANGALLDVRGKTGVSQVNTQTFGSTLIDQGASYVRMNINGSTTAPVLTLALGTLTRNAGSTIDFNLGTGGTITTAPITATKTLSNGILGAWATIGTAGTNPGHGLNWATLDGSNKVVPYTAYTNITTNAATIASAAASNVRVNAAAITSTLVANAATTDVNSLLQAAVSTGANIVTVGIAGNTSTGVLRFGKEGGVLLALGAGSLTVGDVAGNGTITAGGAASQSGELILTNSTNNVSAGSVLTINSIIADNGSSSFPVSVTYSGFGTKAVGTQVNTYTGGTVIGLGRVAVGTNTTAFGANTSSTNITIKSGGQIYATGGTWNQNLFLSGTGTTELNAYGAFRADGATLAGTVTLVTDASIGGSVGNTATVTGKITGSGGLLRIANGTSGIGMLTVNNTANDFSGGTSIYGGGVIQFVGDGTAGGNNVLGSGPILVSGTSSNVTLANLNGYQSLLTSRINRSSTGAITLGLGTAAANENIDFSVTGANLATAYLGAGTALNYAGTYTPQGGVYRFGSGGGTLTYAQNITGSSSVVVGAAGQAAGVGVNLTGTGNNYTGGTTLNNLVAASFDSGSLSTGPITFATGGGLTWNSGNSQDITTNRVVSLNGGTATLTMPEAVTFGSTYGNYGAGAWTKEGAGTLTLNGRGTYSGGTTLNAGTTVIGVADALPMGSNLTINAAAGGANLTLGANQSVNALANSGALDATSGNITLGSNTLTVGFTHGGGNFYAGISGAGGVTKAGNGTQIFVGSTTNPLNYTGLTSITGGTLNLNFADGVAPASNILSGNGNVSLGGGILLLTGKASTTNSQTLANGVTLNAGASGVTVANSATANPTVAILNGITRNTGATLNFFNPANGAIDATNGITTTTLNADYSGASGSQTILGGYATLGASNWAVTSNTAGTNNVTALAVYDSIATPGANKNIDAAAGGALSGTINSLRFNAGAATIDAAGGLVVASGGILNTATPGGAVAINNGTLSAPSGQDLIVHTYNATAMTIGSQITGNGGFTKSGNGALALSNAANNYTGGTYFNEGILTASAVGALGDNVAGNTITIGSKAVQLQFNASGTYNQDITVTGPAIGFSGFGLIQAIGSANVVLAGNINIGGQVTAGSTFANNGTGTMTFAGPINAPAGVTIGHRLGTITYSGGGNYTLFNFLAGTALLGADNGLSTNAIIDFNINNGSQLLDLNGKNQTLAGIKVQSTAVATINNTSATPSTLTLNVADNLSLNYGATTAGVITGNLNVTKSGLGTQILPGVLSNTGGVTVNAGTLNLTASNTYKGTTTINGGRLVMGNADAIGQQAQPNPLVMAGGTLDANGIAAINLASLSGIGGVITDSGLVAGTTTLNTSSSTNELYAGAITDGAVRALSYVKSGSGTQTLTGNSTYTGVTIVDAGTLYMNGALTSSAVTVNTGGKFGGTSSNIGGGATVNTGGTLAAGNSIGTLGLASVDLSGLLEVEYNTTSIDLINVAGLLNLGPSSTVSFVNAGGALDGVNNYVFASYLSLTGTFSAGAAPAGYSIDYAYNNGVSSNNIALVIPEPSSLLLGGLGALALLRRRRSA